MTPQLAQGLWLAGLAALLAAAVWHDLRTMRVPNRVVLAGAACGLVLAALPGGIGAGRAALGMGLGLAVFLPLYLLRAMGAGDVKLLAALGAFAGHPGVLGIALYSLAAGGLLALVWAAATGRLRTVLGNVHIGLLTAFARLSAHSLPRAGDVPTSATRIPYAVALALGTAAYVLLAKAA